MSTTLTRPAEAPASPAPAPRRPWGRVAAAVLAAGLALLAYRLGHRPAPPAYATRPVERGSVVARVTASGTLSARVTVQVGAQVSGRIRQLLVDYNAPVRRGQVLARLDPELFEAALAQARANVASARSALVRARLQAADQAAQLGRTRTLAVQGFVTPADQDTARTNWAVARSQVDSAAAALAQAEAGLRQARVNLAYATIASPIDGVVIARSVDVGQTVAASLQAPTLFVLAGDLGRLQVDTNVSEADVGRLRAGMAAEFQVDAYPGRRFAGRVRQVRNAPQTVQNVVTYDAVIDVANPDHALRPGMTANVAFVAARRDGVLRVPAAALRFRPAAAGGRQVWVQGPEGLLQARAVTTGLADGQVVEVTGGQLREGERVVVGEQGAGREPGASSGRLPRGLL